MKKSIEMKRYILDLCGSVSMFYRLVRPSSMTNGAGGAINPHARKGGKRGKGSELGLEAAIDVRRKANLLSKISEQANTR